VKLKVKLGRRQIIPLVVIAVAICALLVSRSARDEQPAGLDADASRACSDFAAGYPHARTKVARLSLADKVMASSGKTRNALISKRAAEMGRSAGDSDARWKASADALTVACRDAGGKSS
jgi:hypothetical protein